MDSSAANPAAVYAAVHKLFVETLDVSSSDLSTAENSFSGFMKEITQRRFSGFSHEYRGKSGDHAWSIASIQGLLRERGNALHSNIMSLDRAYEERLHMCSGRFDARALLSAPRTTGADSPRRPLATPRSTLSYMRSPATRNLASQFEMAYHPMLATPMTAGVDELAMPRANVVPRLNMSFFRQLPERPSSRLVAFFDACQPSPEEAIALRLNDVQHWLSSTVPSKAQVWALVPRTYYYILEAMLKREQARLRTENFAHLLNDSLYHKALLACTIEVIRYEHKVRARVGRVCCAASLAARRRRWTSSRLSRSCTASTCGRSSSCS
eukprot:Unigene6623_Nuclearia_a/m.20345 Unigene6623_Nuclearia_a/g.20345  ORF Unigene6623_Nuclearia_a/g.20345 Unigene6623_Nuclearia_a/m.20345 type:complete len:325 (-) Unigene6623_Nuclearia_a:338-1312(-)